MIDIPLTIPRGDTPTLRFTLLGKPRKMGGVPVDLTGFEARITITPEQNPKDMSAALVKKAPTQVNPTAGVVEYKLKTAIADLLVPNTYYYGDIQFTSDPVDQNTYTPVRFKFVPVVDYGI